MEKREAIYILLSIVVLTIIFGFNDGQEKFVASYWMANLVVVLFFVSVSFLVYVGMQKFIAKKHGARFVYDLWFVSRFRFKKYRKRIDDIKLPVGIMVGLLMTIISLGRIYFTALGSGTIRTDSTKRVGRPYTAITDYETALVYLGGPLGATLLIFLASWITKLGFDLGLLVTINIWIAIFNLIPFPGIDGSKIITSSIGAYIFFVAFFILSLFLLHVGIAVAILLSIIMAGIIALLYLYRVEK